MFLTLYILVFAALAVNAPAGVWEPGSREFILILGWIGAWRYGWGAVHLVRSAWYRTRVFPRWRGMVDRIMAAGADTAAELRVPEVFIVITSYRIPVETTLAAFAGALAEARRYGGRVTLVAALVERGDRRLVKSLFQRRPAEDMTRLVLVNDRGTGKRDGLALALRAISRRQPAPGSIVLLQDGDTVLPAGFLERTIPFFRIMPGVAALTTDEDCVVPGGGPLMRAWHRLRFAQRHLLMSSMGLSRRLITMTGRMALYRAEIATDPDFIRTIQHDMLDHWRLGRLRLLTGEDKSAAFWLLRRGCRMLYVPDVTVLTIEEPPASDLPRASTMLMLRWFGNMLRASGRCIALGPERVGWFIWWCLVDQRLSMWTPLVGPVAAIMLSLTVSPAFGYIYLLWVMLTRFIQSLLLLTVRPAVSGLYPPLLYYTQIYGALLKTWVLFRLDRQRWTRQNIAWAPSLTVTRQALRAVGSTYLHLLALATLTAGVALATDLLVWPDLATLAALF